MAQAGATAAAAQDTGGLLLNGIGIFGFAVTPFLALASFRAKTDGIAQKAQGSTQALLSYINLPNDQWHTAHPITGSEYEIYFDSLTNSATGQAGIWTGPSTMDAWQGLGSQQTWTWKKVTANNGIATHVILIEIRNIATPANTTGPVSFSFIAEGSDLS